MEGRSFLLLGFFLLAVFPGGKANGLRDLWRHLEENYPYVLPEHSVEEEEVPTVKPPNFTPTELAKIQRLLQRGPALEPDSVLARILEGEQVPDVEAMEGLEPAVISQNMESNPEYFNVIKETFYDYYLEQFFRRREQVKHKRQAANDTGSSSPEQWEDDPDDPQDRDQVGGYEGCKRDYDTLVMPFISNIAYNVLQVVPICELLLEYTNVTGDVLDRLPFCNCENLTEATTVEAGKEAEVMWECTTDLQLPLTETFCEDVYNNVTSEEPILGAIISVILDLLPVCDCQQLPGLPPTWECETNPVEPVNATRWGIRMTDALAKIPTGLTDGKLHWVGGFEMCESIDAHYTWVNRSIFEVWEETEERHVKGRYCRMYVDLGAGMADNEGLNVSGIPLAIGLCVPDTCEEDWVVYYLTQDNRFFTALGLIMNNNITQMDCKKPADTSDDWLYWSVGFIITILIILIAIATIYDLFARKKFVINHYGPQLMKVHKTREVKKKAAFAVNQSQGELPSGYMHVHPEEHRKYSVTNLGISDADLSRLRQKYTRQTSGKGTSMLSKIPQKTLDMEMDPSKLTAFERFELGTVGWSAYTIIHRLFDTNSPPHHMPIFDGVRVFSFGWTLLGGMYVWGPVYNDCFLTANLFRLLRESPENLGFQPVLNFHISSDSFLVISGALLSYWWLRRLEAKGNKLDKWTIIHYIFHRYWRMMPAYMLLLFVYTGTYEYASHTPFFTTVNADGDNCRVNWWTNLLFVMNLVKVDEQCLGWSWQLSILFQLHLATLVVLIPLAIKPLYGYIMLAIMYLASLGSAAGVSHKVYEGVRLDDWYQEYLQTPWCRAGPFCVGLALGIILYNNKKIKMHWVVVLCGWVVGLICIILPVYATYDQFKEGGEMWDRSALVAYDALARTAFGLGLAWLIFACHYGYGSFINTWLSLRMWQPLSKLTFCAWLVHVLMAYVWAYGRYTLFYFSTVTMAWLFLGQMWVAYLVGFLLYVLFHSTISCSIERAVTCKSRMHALLSGRYPGDYFDQFHEAQRLQVSDVDNSEKEEALEQAGIVGSDYKAGWKGWASPPPAYDNNGYLTRSQSEPGVTLKRSTSWQY